MADFSTLKKRAITSFFGIILLFVVLLSELIYIRIAAVFVIYILLTEVYGVYRFSLLLRVCGYMFATGVIVSAFIKQDILKPIAMFIYILILFSLAIFDHKKVKFSSIAIMFFITLIVPYSIEKMVLIRNMEDGRFLIFAVFIGAFMSDTGAYFIGKLFGRHKLIEEVSPKKTVEGSVGGIFASVVGFMIFGGICSLFFNKSVNYLNVFIIAVAASIAGQFGDLAASVIKREQGVKDFGSVLPGHGGFMDRLDSVLFVSPVVYFLLMYLNIF